MRRANLLNEANILRLDSAEDRLGSVDSVPDDKLEGANSANSLTSEGFADAEPSDEALLEVVFPFSQPNTDGAVPVDQDVRMPQAWSARNMKRETL